MKKNIFITFIILIIVIISFICGVILLDKIVINKSKEISNSSKQINEKELSSDQKNNEDLRYYLHKSNLEIPDRDTCYIAQTKALQGLMEDRKEYIKENFRYDHVSLEWNLLDAVNILKDKNSPYWESDSNFSKILENVQSYISELQN